MTEANIKSAIKAIQIRRPGCWWITRELRKVAHDVW